jgi:hypothetical protein
MPNDISVQPIALTRPGGDVASEVKTTPAVLAASRESSAASSPSPNPELQLDPALGVVVIEFRNTAGTVTTSIPSQRQLEAYQRWSVTRVGAAPSGLRTPSTPAAAPPAVEPHAQAPPAKGSK